MSKLKSRNHWVMRQEFFSICSMHMEPQDDCDRCNAGNWRNVYMAKLSSVFYKSSPRLWRLWANRPGSKILSELEHIFPNLKKKG